MASALILGALTAGCQTQGYQPPRNRSPVGNARGRYNHLQDKGDIARHGGILDVPEGYYTGDLLLTGTGMPKKGAGVGQTVIDGHVRIEGHGWTLSNMTIRGDVTIRGDENDVGRCKILGEVIIEQGRDNRR
jgi:hypothetical protein